MARKTPPLQATTADDQTLTLMHADELSQLREAFARATTDGVTPPAEVTLALTTANRYRPVALGIQRAALAWAREYGSDYRG